MAIAIIPNSILQNFGTPTPSKFQIPTFRFKKISLSLKPPIHRVDVNKYVFMILEPPHPEKEIFHSGLKSTWYNNLSAYFAE